MAALTSVVYLLVHLIFDLSIFLLWIRVILRYFKVSPLHPMSHLIYTLTEPLVQPIDRFFSSKKTPKSRYDWVSFALIIGVEFAKFICLGFIVYRSFLPIPYVLLFTLGDLIIQPCNFLFYMILIRAIMSWVNPTWRHPVADIIYLVTDPLLNLGRRIIPDIAGFDFSPILILVLLKVISRFVYVSLSMHLI